MTLQEQVKNYQEISEINTDIFGHLFYALEKYEELKSALNKKSVPAVAAGIARSLFEVFGPHDEPELLSEEQSDNPLKNKAAIESAKTTAELVTNPQAREIILEILGSLDSGDDKIKETLVRHDDFFQNLSEKGLPEKYLAQPKQKEEELSLEQRMEARSKKIIEDQVTLERMEMADEAILHYGAVAYNAEGFYDRHAAQTASLLFLAFTQNWSPGTREMFGHLGGDYIDPHPPFIDEGLEKAQSVPNPEVRQTIVTILKTLRDAAEILDWKEKNRFVHEVLTKSEVSEVMEKIASGQILVPGEEETAPQRLGGSNHKRSSNSLGLGDAPSETANYRLNRVREAGVCLV